MPTSPATHKRSAEYSRILGDPEAGARELRRCSDIVCAALAGHVSTISTYGRPNGSGVPVRVRAFVARGGHVKEITHALAFVLDVKHYDTGILRGGGGYNRALDVLSSAACVVGATLEQGRWSEL